MSECTQTGKPQISILMAVYNPNLDWFREQLLSLNNQTYPNLQLYIRDDCSPKVPHETIREMAEQYITNFPCTVRRNEQNMGSNLTFEKLTAEAEGDIFAYCDQDDVWLPEKLEIMAEDMQSTGALLVCCDVAVIDGEGNKTADSITGTRKHCHMLSGSDLAQTLLFKNFVFGCASIVDAKTAKAAVPFCPNYFHDHFLTLYAAEHGYIHAEPRALINYRIHGANQTGVMLGVKDRDSYCYNRIDIGLNRLLWLREHFDCRPETRQAIEDGIQWMQARKENWTKGRGQKALWHYRYLGPQVSLFELIARWWPNKLLMTFIGLMRKNII